MYSHNIFIHENTFFSNSFKLEIVIRPKRKWPTLISKVSIQIVLNHSRIVCKGIILLKPTIHEEHFECHFGILLRS